MQTALRWIATVVLGLPLLSTVLSGCAGQNFPTKTAVGAGAGGAAGGALAAALGGKNPLLIAGGSLAGMLVGGVAGNFLDQRDVTLQRAATQAFQSPPGTRVPWSNPRTGQQGQITSGVWGLDQGLPCRKFTMQVFLEGRMQEVTGCAVPQGDGTWEIR